MITVEKILNEEPLPVFKLNKSVGESRSICSPICTESILA